MGAGHDRQHAAQGIAFDPPAKIRHAGKVLAQGTQLCHPQGGARHDLAFHDRRQLWRQVPGAEATPGLFLEFFDEQRLGPLMFDIIILLAAAITLGGPQLGPAAGFVGGAPEQLRIDKTLRQPHRMSVAPLPILRQTFQT